MEVRHQDKRDITHIIIVTYTEAMSRFWALHRNYHFTPVQIAVFTALATEWQLTGNPDRLTLPHRYFETTLGISRKTLATVRETLKKKGIIEYEKSVGSAPSAYWIFPEKHQLPKTVICVTRDTQGNTNGDTMVTQNEPCNDKSLNELTPPSEHNRERQGNTNAVCMVTQTEKSPKIGDDTSLKNNNNSNIYIRRRSNTPLPPKGKKDFTAEARAEAEQIYKLIFAATRDAERSRLAKRLGVTEDEFADLAQEVVDDWAFEGIVHRSGDDFDKKDALRHFKNTLVKKAEALNRQKENDNGNDKKTRGHTPTGIKSRLAKPPGCGLIESD